MNHKQFLKRLFDNKPENTKILIHQLPAKSSDFFKTADEAADYIDKVIKGPHNIYTTGGLLRPDIASGRGKKEDIVGSVAMSIDIDLKGPNKPNGVTSLDEAIDLVKSLGAPPTLIIFTGNGIHAWWIYKEPEMFKRASDRERAELRCKRLQETIRRNAAKKNWDIDSTFEVNRVMRIPGTYNRKDPANPIEVRLIEDTGIEYGDPDNDFDEFIVPESEVTKQQDLGGIVWISKDLQLDPNANPPADMYQQLKEIDPRFDTTFKGQLTKSQTKKWKDTSASAYAQSLANMCAKAGWTDQEIADIIIAFYRNNKNNPNISGNPDINKALRPKYISYTIIKARASVRLMELEEYMEMAPLIGTKDEKKIDPNGDKGRKQLNNALGGRMEILSLTEHMAEKDEEYYLEIKFPKIDKTTGNVVWIYQQVHIEDSDQLRSQKKFEDRIFARCQISLNIDPKYWKPVILSNFSKFIEVKAVGEQTVIERMRFWLENYLDGKPVITREEAAHDNSPFVFQGHWHVFPQKFNSWAASTGRDRFGVIKAEIDFSAINANKIQYNVLSSYDNSRKTIRPYKIPNTVVPAPFVPIVIKKEEDVDPINKEEKMQAK